MTASGTQDAAIPDPRSAPPPPDRPRPTGRWWRIALGIVAVGLVLFLAFGFWVYRQIDPSGGPSGEVTIEIPVGSSTRRIAAILDEEEIVTSARIFEIWVKVNGDGPWQAGRYTFRQRSSMPDAVAVLDRGPEIAFVRLTVPEGYTLEQIAQRVGTLPGRSADRFLEVATSGQVRSAFQPQGSTNLEGLLFPDTYTFDDREDEAAILRRMVEAMDQKLVELGIPDAAARLGRTPYEIVIVASMIEREARIPDERGMVAQVVYNRLARGIRLGIDATTRYELRRPTGPLRKSELERDTPYNTRTRAGLPPTPISSPGEASLRAAATPTPGPWIYYVIADASGRHAFVTTDAEFQRAKAEARRKGLL